MVVVRMTLDSLTQSHLVYGVDHRADPVTRAVPRLVILIGYPQAMEQVTYIREQDVCILGLFFTDLSAVSLVRLEFTQSTLQRYSLESPTSPKSFTLI